MFEIIGVIVTYCIGIICLFIGFFGLLVETFENNYPVVKTRFITPILSIIIGIGFIVFAIYGK